MNLFEILRRLDAYPKTLEDLSQKTVGGAAITVIGSVLMAYLLVSETYSYLTPTISEDLFVDTTRNQKLSINMDIIMPRVSCEYLSLDAMDSGGEQHLHIDHDIYKTRLDLNGVAVEDPEKEEISSSTTKKENITQLVDPISKCGDCYGAQKNDTHCCNTCQDVIDAYQEKRWNPDPEKFVQCKREGYVDKKLSGKSYDKSEGCQINGRLTVNRMSGSFHLAPGKSFSLNHIHIHDVQPYAASSFNTSHTIKHLSFGDRIHFANTHPLDDVEVITKEGATMFQYYIKIVPTIYVKLSGEEIQTNQFSVTRHSKTVSVISGESGMPGVFFSYEWSPLMVKYTEKEKSFGHYATNVCAIIGGIFTVAGIIDKIVYNSVYVIRKKMELGKFI